MKKRAGMTCLVLYLIFAALHLVLSTVSKYPVIWDEAGYIGFAAKIMTGSGYSFGYYGGYPLLISIAYLFSDNLETVYRIIQVINALVSGLMPVMVFVLIGRFSQTASIKMKTVIAVLVCVYPHYLIASNSALPEALFAVLFVLFTILGIDILREEKFNLKKCAAIVAVYLYLCFVHPRALALVFVLAGFFVYKWITIKNIRISKTKIILFFASLAVIFALFLALMHILTKSDNINVHHFSSMILDLFSFNGILSFFTALITQFSYLLMATLGIVFLGFYALFTKKENRAEHLFVAFSFIAVMVLSAIFLKHAERADHVLYGRYNEGALIPVFTAGILFLTEQFHRKAHYTLWACAAAVFGFTCLVRGDMLSGLYLTTNNVDSLHIYHLFLPSFQIGWVIGIFALFYLVFYFCCRKNTKAGLVFLFIFLAGSALYTNQGEYDPAINPRLGQNNIVKAIGDFRKSNPGELYINFQSNPDAHQWQMMNYCMNFPDIKIKEFTDVNNLPYPDAPVTITTDDQTVVPQSGKFVQERGIPLTMWIRNQEDISGIGNKGKMSPESYRSHIDVHLNQSYTYGERMVFKTTVTNAGSGMLWQGYDYARDVRDMVRLSVRIFSQTGEEVYATRFSLEENLKPGQSIPISAYIEPWDLEYIRDTYGEGRYTMYLDMVQDYTAWFSQEGDTGTVCAELLFANDSVQVSDIRNENAPPEYNQFTSVRPYLLVVLNDEERKEGFFTNNTTNISSNQMRAESALIENIRLDAADKNEIVLKTRGNNPFDGDINKAKLSIKVNGIDCSFSHFADQSYHFILPEHIDSITSIEIGSALYRPIDATPLPGFLGYTGNSPKFYTFACRAVKKLTGMNMDGSSYGIDIDQIYLK